MAANPSAKPKKKIPRRHRRFSTSELFNNVKFINKILHISKSKNLKKVYNDYTQKLVNLFK